MTEQGMKRRALITGIAGQDGSYLAEFLLGRDYEVHGIEHPSVLDDPGVRSANIRSIERQIHLHFSSLTDPERTRDIVRAVNPMECYHLAAASFVSYAFEDESAILENNVGGTHNLLASLKASAPECRLFFAGTSEMFGTVEAMPQDESTPFRPRSIYGISKLAGHHLVEYYRRQHGLFACTGILYNHESPRRGLQFVTRKITATAAKIKLGLEKKLFLGNLEAVRDWGYAPDYVRAMWMMLRQDRPEDYVIATGTTRSVRDFAEAAFRAVDLDYRDYVELDPLFYREVEKTPLCGNPAKIIARLGWRNTRDLEGIVQEMMIHDLDAVQG